MKKEGFLTYTGELPQGFDLKRAVEEDREERMRKVWGNYSLVRLYFDTSALVPAAITSS